MSYVYAEQRPFVFTEDGQVKLLAVIRKTRQCLELAGAVRASVLLSAARSVGGGDGWEAMAVVGRLTELNMIQVATDSALTPAGQDRVFISGIVPL